MVFGRLVTGDSLNPSILPHPKSRGLSLRRDLSIDRTYRQAGLAYFTNATFLKYKGHEGKTREINTPFPLYVT
jgi:hypothetical protein